MRQTDGSVSGRRRVYGGGRWLTVAKMAAIIFVYGSVVMVAMAAIVLHTLRRL